MKPLVAHTPFIALSIVFIVSGYFIMRTPPNLRYDARFGPESAAWSNKAMGFSFLAAGVILLVFSIKSILTGDLIKAFF